MIFSGLRIAVLAFFLLPPRFGWAVSSPQDQAAFLAGLELPASNPLAALQKSASYDKHRLELAQKWEYCRKARWDAMQSWAQKNIAHKSARGVVRYLFGGPDFLGAHAFFPDADVLVLGGLEPVGVVAPPESLSPTALTASLAATRQAISTALFAGYFVTREMNAQLRQGNFWGVLPLLYTQMALSGNKILSVEAVRPFGSAGVKISYRRGWRHPQTLYYFQANVANGPECARFLSWLDSLGEGASYLKAASYLLHGEGFSHVRSFLLGTSALIVEDDSGIPFRHFDQSRWKIKVFGEYSQPIFSGYHQDDFRDAYATRVNAGPLPFGAGYQVFSDKANILLATRSGGSSARPKTQPVASEKSETVVLAGSARKEPPTVTMETKPRAPSESATSSAVAAAPDSAPSVTSSADSAPRQSLVALEAEELRIRRDPSLTEEQRMRKLRDIWQQQLAVMGKVPA